MVRSFTIEKVYAGIVPKSTLFKVLQYLDREAVETPALLVDADKIREKISLIGSGIRNARVFYAVKANPDIKILSLLNTLKAGFEIASEGELEILFKQDAGGRGRPTLRLFMFFGWAVGS